MQDLMPQAARLVPIVISLLFTFVFAVAGATVLYLGWRSSRAIPRSEPDTRRG